MTAMTRLSPPGRPARILLLGGTSEIGLAILTALHAPADTQVLLAGRDTERLAAAGRALPYQVTTLRYDATALASHEELIKTVFADGDVDLVISAAGVLVAQEELDRDPLRAGLLVETNFTGHVTTLLAAVERMRAQRAGTIVILSSVAAIRPRKFNPVYGAAKAGLDGVRVLLVRPGFVIGRMTEGMAAAPLATTPAQVGTAVVAALDKGDDQVWVPASLAALAAVIRLIPRPLWRRVKR